MARQKLLPVVTEETISRFAKFTEEAGFGELSYVKQTTWPFIEENPELKKWLSNFTESYGPIAGRTITDAVVAVYHLLYLQAEIDSKKVN